MTSSTVSRLSAPRSSTKDASGVTRSSSTPSWSTMIFFTRSATGSMKLLRGIPRGIPFELSARTPRVHEAPGAEGPPVILHMKAAVHGQHLAGDVGGRVGEQEDHDTRDVGGLPGPAEGDGGRHRLAGFRRHGRRHVGLDEPG